MLLGQGDNPRFRVVYPDGKNSCLMAKETANDYQQLFGGKVVELCQHLMPSGRSALVKFNGGFEMCFRCQLITERPVRKTSWESVKDYFRAWWRA